MDLHYFTPQPSPFSTASRVTSISPRIAILFLHLIPYVDSSLIPLLFLYYVRASCSSLVLYLLFRLILERLKTADFERGMKLVTSRIDVRNDDRLMHLVFKEAVANGAVEI